MTEHNINSANAVGYYNDSTWDYVWRFLNDVDLVMRLNNENAFVWWASKRFYSMVGDGQFGTTEHAPLPRGWALTHYARYTTDTTRIETGVSNNVISGAFADGTPIGNIGRFNSLLNNSTDDMDNVSPRVTAYVSQDGNEISVIAWTPTKVGGDNGNELRNLKIDFPAGFKANGVRAHRSTGDKANQIWQPDDTVILNAARTSAYVNVNRSEILSVKFTK